MSNYTKNIKQLCILVELVYIFCRYSVNDQEFCGINCYIHYPKVNIKLCYFNADSSYNFYFLIYLLFSYQNLSIPVVAT